MSSKELSDEEMRKIAMGIKCSVSLIGQVEGKERWDYCLEKRTELNFADRALLKKSDLEVLE